MTTVRAQQHIRAVTVRQPHAWAIIHGGKPVENRSQNIAGSYRGLVAIHAGLHPFEQDNMSSRAHRASCGTETLSTIVFGAIIGVVDLVDVHQCAVNLGCYYPADVLGWVPALGEGHKYETCSEWGIAGHHHLMWENPRPLATPIPAKGHLGLWTLTDELAAQIAEQVAA